VAQELSPRFDTKDSSNLIEKVNNPISGITMLPFESNLRFGAGSETAFTYALNFEPVVPLSISSNWRVLTRTVMPLIYQEQTAGKSITGMGDTELTFFLSPRTPRGGFTWGAGPVWLMPTATNSDLGSRQWAVGPAAMFVHQYQGWTMGLLVNHLSSFAEKDPSNTNVTLMNSWMSHSWRNGLTLKIESESRYDWKASEWTVPLEFGFSKLTTQNKQPVNIGADMLYYAARGSDDPAWGMRFTINVVFAR